MRPSTLLSSAATPIPSQLSSRTEILSFPLKTSEKSPLMETFRSQVKQPSPNKEYINRTAALQPPSPPPHPSSRNPAAGLLTRALLASRACLHHRAAGQCHATESTSTQLRNRPPLRGVHQRFRALICLGFCMRVFPPCLLQR